MKYANDNDVAFKPPLMSPKEAAVMTTFSRTMLRLMSESGLFPRHVELGTRRIAYVRAEVEAWIDARIAARAA